MVDDGRRDAGDGPLARCAIAGCGSFAAAQVVDMVEAVEEAIPAGV